MDKKGIISTTRDSGMRASGGDDDGMAFESESGDKGGDNRITEVAASHLGQSSLP